MRPRDEAVVAGDAIALDNGRQLVEQCCEFAELAGIGRTRICTANGSPSAAGLILAP